MELEPEEGVKFPELEEGVKFPGPGRVVEVGLSPWEAGQREQEKRALAKTSPELHQTHHP